MATFQNTVTIARPADEVFAFLADFGNIPAWNYAITRTVQASPGPTRVGATYRQTRTVPRRSEEGFEVTIFTPPSRLAIKGQIGPFNASSSYLLEPAAGGIRLPKMSNWSLHQRCCGRSRRSRSRKSRQRSRATSAR
jgi:hypothetical protein